MKFSIFLKKKMGLRTLLKTLVLPRRSYSAVNIRRNNCTYPSAAMPVLKRKGSNLEKPSAPFVDRKEIKVTGGKGGDGCIAFTNLFANELAGPDGGDGGNGGHVLFKSSYEIKSLVNVPSIIRGRNGVNGTSRNCYGANAEHLIVKVPVGTVFKKESGEVVVDLNDEDALFIGAKGGAGGKGNKFFATAENQSPEMAEYGAEGETFSYVVEMSTIAHFGLVGYPNAGKSTLLRAISRARPKVADYPFTTLRPHVGMVVYDDMEQVAVADIPGIIEDAHKNRGLGIQFLRHIQRCLCLIYVVDFSSEDPWSEYETLKSELFHYDPGLVGRNNLIVANKMDLPAAKINLQQFKTRISEDIPVFPISAKLGENVQALLLHLRSIYDKLKEKKEKDVLYNPVRHETKMTSWRRPPG